MRNIPNYNLKPTLATRHGTATKSVSLKEALDFAYEDIANSRTNPNTLFSRNMKRMFAEQKAILKK